MKILRLLSLVTVFGLVSSMSGQASDQLIDLVPNNSKFIFDFNAKKFMASSFCREALEKSSGNADYDQFKAKLAKYNLKIENLADSIIAFGSGDSQKMDFGILVKTSITKEILTKILAQEKKADFSYEEVKMNGMDVFVFDKTPSLPMPSLPGAGMMQNTQNNIALTYLKPDVTLITEKAIFSKIVKSVKETLGKNAKVKSKMTGIDPDATMWACFEIPKTPPNPNANPMVAQMNPLNCITGGNISLNLGNAKTNDIRISAVLDGKSAQQAGMFMFQIQGYKSIFAGYLHESNKELGEGVNNAIKINTAGDKVKLTIDISESMQKQIKDYMDTQGGGMMAPLLGGAMAPKTQAPGLNKGNPKE